MTTLTSLQLEQLKRIEVVLTNMGCTYAIRDPDGVMHGDLDALTNKKSKRGPMKFPRGTVRNYFRPFVENLKEGEAAMVPYDVYDPYSLQSNIGSYLSSLWGAKTFVTTQRPELKSVEILRSGGI